MTWNFRRCDAHSSDVKSVMDQFLLQQPPGKLKMWLLQVHQQITWSEMTGTPQPQRISCTLKSTKNIARKKKNLNWWLCTWKNNLHIEVKKHLLIKDSFIPRQSCTQGLQLELFQFCQQQSISQKEGWFCKCVSQTGHISGSFSMFPRAPSCRWPQCLD